MKTFALRDGFACNSSSTHSILLLTSTEGLEPIEPAPGEGYGRDRYQLVTREARATYLAAQLISNLRDLGWTDQIEPLIAAFVPEAQEARGMMFDHGELAFPRAWKVDVLHFGWFRALVSFVMEKPVVITCGDDELIDKDTLPAEQRPKRELLDYLRLRRDADTPFIVRHDPLYDYWTLFCRQTGTRARMTFRDTVPEVEYATLPELVDVKITDQCHTGCTYCYMGSTPEGEHAEWEYLESFARDMGRAHVFEVAIGGGEPTLHPDLLRFAQALREHGVVPNLTTRSLEFVEAFVQDPGPWGAVAFSVDSAEQARALAELVAAGMQRAKRGTDAMRNRICLQYVLGLTTNETVLRDLFRVLKEFDFLRLTLLGYKHTGRGLLFREKPALDWFRIAQEEGMVEQLGIDTTLARVHVEGLVQQGVDPRTITVREGQFSCYVDAVKQRLRLSSYDEQEGVPYERWGSFVDLWGVLHGEPDPSDVRSAEHEVYIAGRDPDDLDWGNEL